MVAMDAGLVLIALIAGVIGGIKLLERRKEMERVEDIARDLGVGSTRAGWLSMSVTWRGYATRWRMSDEQARIAFGHAWTCATQPVERLSLPPVR